MRPHIRHITLDMMPIHIQEVYGKQMLLDDAIHNVPVSGRKIYIICQNEKQWEAKRLIYNQEHNMVESQVICTGSLEKCEDTCVKDFTSNGLMT